MNTPKRTAMLWARVYPDEKDELEKEASRRGRKPADLVREAVEDLLKSAQTKKEAESPEPPPYGTD